MAEDLKRTNPDDETEPPPCPACSVALDRLEAAFQAWAEQTGDLHPNSTEPETPEESVLHNKVWGLLYLHRLLARENVFAAVFTAGRAREQAGRAALIEAVRKATAAPVVMVPAPERKM